MTDRPAGDLAGRNAVVTGAGSGIGRATAIRLAAAGATVGCLDRNGDAARQTVEIASAMDGRSRSRPT